MPAGPMLQDLLEDRFRLKTHRETRELPVYAMTVGKDGLKVQPLAGGGCETLDLTHPPPPPKPGHPPPNVCGVMIMGPNRKGEMTLEVRGSTMTQFAQRLTGRTDRPVIDLTGIAGMFNFHFGIHSRRIRSRPDSPRQLSGRCGQRGRSRHPVVPADTGPSLFAALQEQIGLKLSSGKGPVPFLIIDRAEKPTANRRPAPGAAPDCTGGRR
jgi:uncharacterized protein (TIGR03435 family)